MRFGCVNAHECVFVYTCDRQKRDREIETERGRETDRERERDEGRK